MLQLKLPIILCSESGIFRGIGRMILLTFVAAAFGLSIIGLGSVFRWSCPVELCVCIQIRKKKFQQLKETNIWAKSWENLFMPYANNKGADQPAHPRSLISTFVVYGPDSIISLVSISKISSLYLASIAAKAGLSRKPQRQVLSWQGSDYIRSRTAMMFRLHPFMAINIWADSWQKQQNDLCA